MKKLQDSKTGLDSRNRSLLVALFFLILLIWGPIAPYGMVIRIAYLIILPSVLGVSLSFFGKKWKGDKESNNRLNCGIAGIIAGVFFAGAYLSFTARYHTECTQSIRTYDGSECVGDYVKVKGSDIAGAVTLAALGGISFWYSISKRDNS